MKKLSLLFFSLLCVSVVYAQKGKVSAANNYAETGEWDAAKEAIDAALSNPASNQWPKTYIVAGKVYGALEREGKSKVGYDKAVEFYKKAIELDAKGDAKGKGINKFNKEIKVALTLLSNDLVNAAVNNFGIENFSGALSNFESILWSNKFSSTKYDEINDSVFVWNAALAAYNAKDWAKSELYFQKCINFKYPGADAVSLLNNVYTETGDKAKLEANLKNGITLYPDNQALLAMLIQHYIGEKQNKEALDYLETAIAQDPNNPSFYYAQGVLMEGSDKQKAIESYNKSLEIDPNYFNALYNLGVIYYNLGVEDSNKANDLTDRVQFDKAKKAADDIFRKALPYMEKAAEVMPSEPAVWESLKSLYYRFEMMDKYNEAKSHLENL